MPVVDETLTEKAAVRPIAEPLTLGYRRYALFILMLAFMVNFIDRQVINILAEPIKKELGLADWQIGLMTGFAFALCYSTLGLPIARLAERRSRPVIIGTSIALWSSFTAACGFVVSYTQLLLLRVGVGIGEAGCTPPAHSLIMDYSPPEKRASSIAFYHMGVPLGSLLGLAIGGIIADAYGWRTAFIICGLPGILVALLVAVTLPEPRKQRLASSQGREPPSFRETLTYLRSKRSFWQLALGAGFKGFVAYGQGPFIASFFYRVHLDSVNAFAADFGLKSQGFMGLALGLVGGVTGILGTWLGGVISDRAALKDVRALTDIPAVTGLLGVPLAIAAFMVDSVPLALGLLFVSGILTAIWSGPIHAGVLGVAPPEMRATTSAILLFILNGIGLGLGPLTVGVLSDGFDKWAGLGSGEGLRWALIVSTLAGVGCNYMFWAARRTIRSDLAI